MEDDISKVVTRRFPDLQRDYANLASELRNLGLAGAETAEGVQDSLSEILKGDASDAAARLGPEECPLFENLLWARDLDKGLKGHLPAIVRRANRYIEAIPKLPAVGPLAALQAEVQEDLAGLREVFAQTDFFTKAPDIQTRVSRVEKAIETAAASLVAEYNADLESTSRRLEQSPNWPRIGGDNQEAFAAQLDALQLAVEPSLDGIRACLDARYPLQQRVAEIAHAIARIIEEQEREDPSRTVEPPKETAEEVLVISDFELPTEITSRAELDVLIGRLQALRSQLDRYAKILLRP